MGKKVKVGIRFFNRYKKLYLMIPCIYLINFIIVRWVGIIHLQNRSDMKAGRYAFNALAGFILVYQVFSICMIQCCNDVSNNKKIKLIKNIGLSIKILITYVCKWLNEIIFQNKRDNPSNNLFGKICYINNGHNFYNAISESNRLCLRFYDNVNMVYKLIRYQLLLMIPFSFMYYYVTGIVDDKQSIGLFLLLLIVLYYIFRFCLVIYLYHVVLWNEEWEKTYADILARNEPAPNIKTIPFPNL